jgi:hypothetical protein
MPDCRSCEGWVSPTFARCTVGPNGTAPTCPSCVTQTGAGLPLAVLERERSRGLDGAGMDLPKDVRDAHRSESIGGRNDGE